MVHIPVSFQWLVDLLITCHNVKEAFRFIYIGHIVGHGFVRYLPSSGSVLNWPGTYYIQDPNYAARNAVQTNPNRIPQTTLFGRVDYDLKNNIQMLILTGFIDFD
jgi:hypothetical protein